MKSVTLLSVFVAGCASPGTFVDRGMFNESAFVVGDGASKDQADRRARKATPSAYEIPRDATIVWLCGDVGESSVWRTETQDYECESGHYRKMIGVVPKDAKLRAMFDEANASTQGTTPYVGVADTLSEAVRDLQSKLPKTAVINSYSIGCTGDIITDRMTGHSSCAGPNNKLKISTRVIEPNAAKVLPKLNAQN